MRTVILLALLATCGFAAENATPVVANPAGRWQCLIPAFDHSLRPLVFQLKTGEAGVTGGVTGIVKGEIYDGKALPDSPVTEGSFEGAKVTFFARIPVHGGVRLTRYSGVLTDGSTMELKIARADGRRPPVSCTAKRVGE